MKVLSCAFFNHMSKDSDQNLEELIVTYIQRGVLYEDILKLLKRRCGINLSIRTFNPIIKALNLKRKNVSFLTNELINDVQESIESGGENRDYRNICSVPTFLRRNHADWLIDGSSYQYGTFVSNQKCDGWWSIWKRDSLQTWIN